MSEENYLVQVRQILQWMKDDENFREYYFDHPEDALDQLAGFGYEVSDKARRFLIRRVKKDTFETEYERLFAGTTFRGGTAAAPDLPPLEEFIRQATGMMTANGGGRGPRPEPPPERFVNTGFAAEDRPDRPWDADRPLVHDCAYYFWFEVGGLVEGGIDVAPAELPVDKLPPEARLHVALFGFPDQLQIIPGEDVGEIQIMPDGSVRVAKAVAMPDELDGSDLLEKRLFFPVRTPAKSDRYQLRCNIYFQQTLVQSHLVSAQVGPARDATDGPMLATEMDYTISRALDGRQLHGMGENRLSLMLNDNGNGTHGFRFFGRGEFKNDASLGEGELINLIAVARGAMNRAAWGDKEPYAPGKAYRYADGLDEDQLLNDLVFMAIRGKRFYTTLITDIAGDSDRAWDLEDLMAKPGQIQLASKESVNRVVPIAMFYDYPLDDGTPNNQFSLCSAFRQALHDKEPLEETVCFQGNCPTRDEKLVVCPSGFWGYRHSIGLPVSVKTAPDPPLEIPSPGIPKMAVSVSTDPAFVRRPTHEQALKAMGFGWEYADSRDESLDMLKATESQVVYFYCHGGLTEEKFPYLLVGPLNDKRFTRANLFDWRIRWRDVRPLVFINGCHTTALSPEAAIDLVSGFVETSHAAGVIGTEITNFEPLAADFAEECLRRFLKERQSLGEAVRGARLKTLKEGNPLGLIYIVFALPGLKVA